MTRRMRERNTVGCRDRGSLSGRGIHWIRRMRPALAVVPALVALLFLFAAEASACPNCKDAVNTADPDGLNMARGYFYSILIMLAMPLTLVGSFGVYVWREMRRLERAAATVSEGTGAATGPGLAPAAAASVAAAAPRP